MPKTILVTGASDGIGRLTAERLLEDGHRVLLHGRSAEKLAKVAIDHKGVLARLIADLAVMSDVRAFADQLVAGPTPDVLIHNAGVLKADPDVAQDGLDIRFAVNTVAPYLVTTRLLPHLPKTARVVTVASAAQAPVEADTVFAKGPREAMAAYAQSKLASILWTRALAAAHQDGPVFLSVNPGSLLGSKMVREAFGYRGRPLSIGADILCHAACDAEFADRSGAYFDNDKGQFSDPHASAMDPTQTELVMQILTEC